MRRKQLYAIILAGALAASSAPAAVFAAEGDVAATAETSEENPVDGETAAATEAPAEETPADTTAATEAPAQEAAAATEAPAQEAAPSEQTQQTTATITIRKITIPLFFLLQCMICISFSHFPRQNTSH